MFFSKPGREKIDADGIIERTKNEPELELEKGDLKAIIIAAMVVMLPALVVFVSVVLFVYWLFIGRF